jgi:hypothetical protein
MICKNRIKKLLKEKGLRATSYDSEFSVVLPPRLADMFSPGFMGGFTLEFLLCAIQGNCGTPRFRKALKDFLGL